MAWTYDSSLPENRDKVRLLVGDTISTDQQLQDGEIDYLLTVEAGVFTAAASAARAIAARYARQIDKAVGDLKLNAEKRFKHYMDLSDTLESQGSGYGLPTAGGVYVAEKEAAANDDRLVQPMFRVGMDDF